MAFTAGDGYEYMTHKDLVRECRNKQKVINHLNDILDGKPRPEGEVIEALRDLLEEAEYGFDNEGWGPDDEQERALKRARAALASLAPQNREENEEGDFRPCAAPPCVNPGQCKHAGECYKRLPAAERSTPE